MTEIFTGTCAYCGKTDDHCVTFAKNTTCPDCFRKIFMGEIPQKHIDDLPTRLRELVDEWKYRQACNNQPMQTQYAKAKAHIYGICANELEQIVVELEKEKQ